MQLAVREIRLLSEDNWKRWHAFTPQELAAYHKLLDKGLVVREEGQVPKLSDAGEMTRRMLVLSKHIILPESPVSDADGILQQIIHALQWYGGNGMSSMPSSGGLVSGVSLSARSEKDSNGKRIGLIVKTTAPDYDKKMEPGYEHLRPKKSAEYRIILEKVDRIG